MLYYKFFSHQRMTNRTSILGIPFDAVTRPAAVERVAGAIHGRQLFHVVTAGPEFVMAAKNNEQFRRVLQSADLSIPDGFGIILASRLLGRSRLQRVSGMDFLSALIQRAAVDGWGVFLFGASSGIAEQAAAYLLRQHPSLKVVGVDSGFRSGWRLPDKFITWRIRRSGAQLLLVALGAPKQEVWIDQHRRTLGRVRIAVGVGGAFDFWSGVISRSPRLLQQIGLEWLWRLFQEPRRRWPRIVTAIWRFPLAVLREKLRVDGNN